jgi:hypothetical protein
VSEVTTNFWLGMALLVAWMVGMWAAAFAGSISGSIWVAAGAGAAVGIAFGCALQFGRKAVEDETRLNRTDWLGVLSKSVAIVAALALASLAIYQIVQSGPNELGFMDYDQPAFGGWAIGALIVVIWTYAKTRKSDVTQ